MQIWLPSLTSVKPVVLLAMIHQKGYVFERKVLQDHQNPYEGVPVCPVYITMKKILQS